MSNKRTIEIFRVGEHVAADGRKINFSAADLQGCADAYDPKLHEAPAVVGHPAHDAPAYGWAAGLKMDGNALVADLDQVDPAFAELAKAGRFKKISPSFYLPDSAANPKPGKYYLRHIGFLGAQPPAVKGLKPIAFKEDDADTGVVTFGEAATWSWPVNDIAGLLRGVREFFIAKFSLEDADRVMPSWRIDSIEGAATRAAVKDEPADALYNEHTPKEPTLKTKTPEEREAELAAREAALTARDAQFAEAQVATRRTADDALLAQMVKDGKLSPTAKPEMLAFMGTLDAKDTVQFAEGGEKQTPHAYFRALLGKAGKIVDFGEVSKGDGERDALPADAQARGAALARKALDFIEAKRAKGVTVTLEVAMAEIVKQETQS